MARAYFDGRIAEILIFNKELSNAEIAQINSYLANKWSLTTRWIPITTASPMR